LDLFYQERQTKKLASPQSANPHRDARLIILSGQGVILAEGNLNETSKSKPH
jgi:hypothetical protein